MLSSTCDVQLPRDSDDIVFSLDKTTAFFRSGDRFQEVDDKVYYETFIIDTSSDPMICVGRFYTYGDPMYGSALKTALSADSETVVFRVPDGRIEVSPTGSVTQWPEEPED